MYADFLFEDFRVYTRDHHANWLTQVDEIMDDVDGEKTILKQSPGGRNITQSLTVYPFIEEGNHPGFFIEIFQDRTARMRETYPGEAIPVLRFLISRWPAYGEIVEDDTGETLAAIATMQRPRLRDQNPQQWYHGTTTQHLPDIMRLGLMPRDVSQRNYRGLGGSETGLVYLTTDEHMAQGHAENSANQFGGAAVVLQVDLTGLEDRIVDDHDVRFHPLRSGDSFDRAYDAGDLTTRRIRQTPGEASFLTMGTVAVKGRIPANHVRVVWQGKEKKGRIQNKSEMYGFINDMAGLAKQLNRNQLSDLFRIIGVQISGWRPEPYFADRYYADPEKTINSVFVRRSQPKQFARWVRGMKLRAGKLRRSTQRGLGGPQQGAIVQLIDAMANKLAQ